MNHLLKNMNILQHTRPVLHGVLSRTDSAGDDFVAAPSTAGEMTAQLSGKFIHSSRDPVREARKIVTSHLASGVTTCIIEGFGLGYYAEAALQLFHPEHVIIVDPSPERFKAALESRDVSHILAQRNVQFLLGEKAEAISSVLTAIGQGELAVIRNRTLYMADTLFYEETERYISRFTARRKVNEATLRRFGHIWIRNLIYNMNILPESSALQDVENLFPDIPVLLLAAGPSLTAVLPRLKELRERFVLVAVDTASEALLRYGVSPDFLVVIDPQYWNTRHLDRIDMRKTILVSESSTYPSVFRKHHKMLYLSGSLFPLGQFMESFTGHRKRLGAGGSVSTSAWDFCHFISSSPVYCAGLDLGFPDGETHYKGSFFEERAHIFSSRTDPAAQQAFLALHGAHPFPVPDNTGGITLTDQRLIVYKQWFEERMYQSPERLTYTTSPRGVKIKGITFIPVEKLFTLPPKRHVIDTLLQKLTPPVESKRRQAARNILQGVYLLMEELETLHTLTTEGIHTIDTCLHESDTSSYNETGAILDALDRKIIDMNSKAVSGFLIQPLLRDVMKNSNENPLLISRNLYSAIRESSDYHLKLLTLFVNNHKESTHYTEL